MKQYSQKTIQPIPYTGEILLRMGHAPREIGTQIKMGNRPDTYQVTRVEPNGLCFGVDVDFLDSWRLD